MYLLITQWTGKSKLWKKLHSSGKNFHVAVVKGLFEAQGQDKADDIKMYKITQNLGSGAKFPYLGMVVSTSRASLSLSVDDNRNV